MAKFDILKSDFYLDPGPEQTSRTNGVQRLQHRLTWTSEESAGKPKDSPFSNHSAAIIEHIT